MSRLHGMHQMVQPSIPVVYRGRDGTSVPHLAYGDPIDIVNVIIKPGTQGKLWNILHEWGGTTWYVINFEGEYGSTYIREQNHDCFEAPNSEDATRLKTVFNKH